MSGDKLRPVQTRRKPSKALVITVAGGIAASFASYGVYGLSRDDLVLPYRHTTVIGSTKTTQWLHFHGAAALLLFAGFLCIVAACAVWMIKQLSANPDAKTGSAAAAGLVITGFCIIVVMQCLKLYGLV